MRIIGALLIATVVLAGCARGEGDEPSAPTRTRTPLPATSEAAAPSREAARVDPREGGLELGFGEYAIALEAEEIRPGRVTFVVRNGGTMIHGFEIESEDDDDGDLKFEGPAMGPGDVVRLEADLAPGTYKIECFVDGHDDLGMEALLVVRPDAPLVVEEPSGGHGLVAIEGFAFAPEELEVPSGTEVRWRNDDPAAHTVTDEGGAFDSGTLEAGGTFSTVLDRPGIYAYLCQIHPTMRGTIRVTGT